MTSNQEGIAEGYLSACEQENRELRAENERLTVIGAQMRAQLDASTETMNAAGVEITRLRAELRTCQETLTACLESS